MGVSTTAATLWWRHAGAMKLISGYGGGGIAEPGNASLPGGHGRRLNLDERIAIMRGVDVGLSCAAILSARSGGIGAPSGVKYAWRAMLAGTITPGWRTA